MSGTFSQHFEYLSRKKESSGRVGSFSLSRNGGRGEDDPHFPLLRRVVRYERGILRERFSYAGISAPISPVLERVRAIV